MFPISNECFKTTLFISNRISMFTIYFLFPIRLHDYIGSMLETLFGFENIHRKHKKSFCNILWIFETSQIDWKQNLRIGNIILVRKQHVIPKVRLCFQSSPDISKPFHMFPISFFPMHVSKLKTCLQTGMFPMYVSKLPVPTDQRRDQTVPDTIRSIINATELIA